MNIQTVAENLRNTIAGKEMLLAKWRKVELDSPTATNAMNTMINMLELNIDDLVKVLADVEVCVDQFEKLKKENSDMGWQINPDRMGQ